MKLSPHEMAWCLLQAGFIGNDVVLGVAMGLAESGGDTDIIARSTTGDNLGQRDHGVWQVSGRWNWDKIQKTPNWRDPVVNAKIAKQIFDAEQKKSGNGWNAWSTFKDIPAVGTTPAKPAPYKQWLPDATIAAAHPWPVTLSNQVTVVNQTVDLTAVVGKLNEVYSQVYGLSTAETVTKESLDSLVVTVNEIRGHFK